MNTLHVELRLDRERRQRQIREARQHRLARRTELRRQRPPVRRAVGRSLVRLGRRLADESDSSIQPARSP